MNIIKHLFISILLLSMPIISKGQEATIDFYYNKQSDSIIINISNNTENEMLIRSPNAFEQFSGSYILLIYMFNEKRYTTTVPLYMDMMKDGRMAPMKRLAPKQKLDFSRSINSLKENNIIKTELNLIIFITDKNTGKVTTQRYLKEVDIK